MVARGPHDGCCSSYIPPAPHCPSFSTTRHTLSQTHLHTLGGFADVTSVLYPASAITNYALSENLQISFTRTQNSAART
jgi:hypothetical protein